MKKEISMTQLLQSRLDPIRDANAEELKGISSSYSGITYTKGRIQPYAVWLNGCIETYEKTESNARSTQLRLMRY